LGFFINATIEQLPRTEDVIAELGWETGRMFAEKHIPTWQTRSRLYYELPYDDFNKGVMALRENKLQEAAAIFRSYTDHKNRKTAALSMYNMAVICELEGEYDLALAWLRKSLEVKYYSTTQEYIKVLKQRIEDLDAISMSNERL